MKTRQWYKTKDKEDMTKVEAWTMMDMETMLWTKKRMRTWLDDDMAKNNKSYVKMLVTRQEEHGIEAIDDKAMIVGQEEQWKDK